MTAADDEWKKCSCCKEVMEKNHYTDTRQLQGYFSNRVKDILKGLGRKVICWNDSLETDNFGWETDTAGEIMVQFWSGQYADAMQRYIREGRPFIYLDMFELYLDYPSAMTFAKKVYNTVPMIRKEDYSGAEGFAGMSAACGRSTSARRSFWRSGCSRVYMPLRRMHGTRAGNPSFP